MSESPQQRLRWQEDRSNPSGENAELIERAAKMSGPVRIVADSGSDLTPTEAQEQSVTLVPLIVRFGDDSFPETEISREEFWRRAETGPLPPKTSQPSIGAFEAAFGPLIQQGANVLCITVTGRHSGTYNSAWAAAQRFPERVLVWDSQSLSIGMGLQVLQAAKLVQQERPLWEIVQHLDEIRRNSRLTILLDTVDYLRRGGRVDGMISALDRLVRILNIRALLRMNKGELRVLGAARSYRRGLTRLRTEALEMEPLSFLGVGHARRPVEATRLAEDIASQAGLPEEAILLSEVGAALASHSGPGVVGVVSVSAPE